MIIPKNHPLFQKDGVSFKQKMLDYIRENFSDILKDDVKLLDSENGLEMLSLKLRLKLSELNSKKAVA